MTLITTNFLKISIYKDCLDLVVEVVVVVVVVVVVGNLVVEDILEVVVVGNLVVDMVVDKVGIVLVQDVVLVALDQVCLQR